MDDREQASTEQNATPPANNSGAIFRNRYKRHDRQPDYRGRAVVDGHEYLVSGWIKTSQRGEKYMTLAFTPETLSQPPQQTSQYQPGQQAQNASEGQYESHSYGQDDVPF